MQWSRRITGGGVPRKRLLKLGVLGLLGLTMIGPAMTMGGDQLGGGGSAARQFLYIGTAVLILVALRPFIRPSRSLVIPLPIMFALGYCAFSLSWSIAPQVGARRLLLTTVIIWSVFASVRHLAFETVVGLLRTALFAAVLGNIATAVLLPRIGVHQADDVLDKNLIGEWCGFMMQKNIASAATAYAILLLLFGGGRRSWNWRVPALAVAAFLLVKTGSRTSIGMCCGAALLGCVYLGYNARYRIALLVSLILALLAAAALPDLLQVDLASPFRDPKVLSGRLDVWDVVLRYSHDHPLRGAGYGSFWDVGPASPVFLYGKGWVVDLAQGHDGYLDLLATIGIPGLSIVVFAVLVLPLFRVLASRAAEGARGAMLISTIMFCAGQNATETSLFDRDSISQVMLMFAVALVIKATPDLRLRPYRPDRRPILPDPLFYPEFAQDVLRR